MLPDSTISSTTTEVNENSNSNLHIVYPLHCNLSTIQYCVSCYIIQISIPGIISQRPKEKKGRNSQEISFKIKLY